MGKFTFEKSYDLLLGVFSVIMLVFPKMIVLGFAAFLIIVILGMQKKKMHFKLHAAPVLFGVFYLVYVLYILGTRNPHQAGIYVENKLSFLLIPILFSFKLNKPTHFKLAILGFITGTLILVTSSFISGFECYMSDSGGKHCFLASEFSYQHHPTYSSSYYMLSLFLLWYGWKNKIFENKLFVILPVSLVLIFCIGASLSLSGILFFFLLVATMILVIIYRKWGKWIALACLIIAPFVMYFTITSIPQIEGEWNNAKWYADEYRKDPEGFVKSREFPMSGTEIRIVMWTVSTRAISNYPFGIGTGNVDEVLRHELHKIDQHEMAKQDYNPHNQYLQTGIEIGIIGLLVLFGIIAMSVRQAFRYSNWILLFLASNLAFNMLFESMLQRQSGIVFFTFWLCFLFVYSAMFGKQKRVKE